MEEVLRYGRMMFIYDTSCCTREEDDPAEAICFLRCGGGGGRSVEPLTDEVDADGAATVVDSTALHLVCQLMGTAFFTEKNMAAFPSIIRLRHGQFVLHREGNFIWVMHTSGEDETYVTRAQLARTRQALGVLHGGLPTLLASVGGDRARLRRRLSRTLGPLLAAAGSQPSLERVLDVLPRLNWAQKDDFIAQQLCDVQTAVLRLPGVLACVLCWDAKVVSTDGVEELAETLVHIHWLPEDAFDVVDVDFVLPPGVMVARVHLDGDLYASVRGAAESRWISPGPEKVVPSSSPSELPPLNSIDEATEPGCGGGSSSTQDGGTDGRGKENRPADCRRRRRHRRRHRSSPSRPKLPAEGETAVSPPADGHDDGAEESESESPSVVRHRISALALQALSAECARTEPPPPPSLDTIPVRRLRRPRSGRRPRRTLTELDVPEPFSNLAFLKRRQPELYRDELRKLQASLPDNQPAFTAVSANPYSFGIPRSNRLYTPRPAGAAPLPPPSPLWRPAGGAPPAGYVSESSRLTGSPRGPPAGRRFFSDGEETGWRPRQLAALLRDGGAARPPAADRLTAAHLYTHSLGKLRCHVVLEERSGGLRGAAQQLSHLTGAGLVELESMLRSYRSIPSFHGQHYSYVSVRDRGTDGGAAPTVQRQLESEGVSQLDGHVIQMVHADLLAGRLADCRIRTPSDVLLAQRSGSTETIYQQRTSGHQTGLPVVNGPLCRLDDRARKRLGQNHGLTLR